MKRREFLLRTVSPLLLAASAKMTLSPAVAKTLGAQQTISLFLCGDVMTGRGIDQVLPHPSAPQLYEPYVRHAREYVHLAEQANGPIPAPVEFAYIWGDAIAELERMGPDVRIINLETSVTTNDDYWRDKGINYRMHPKNMACITAAKIDCCVLANNHVLDWGRDGLTDTLKTLHDAKLKTAGAGRNSAEAAAPAIVDIGAKGRVVVFSLGTGSSGIPPDWTAGTRRPGVNLLPDLSEQTVRHIGANVQAVRRPRDVVVASIHWGGNWGYEISGEHVEFAHRLIDTAGADIVHGHSCHHPQGIEVYQDRLIIYGCGDLINDYEGISGYDEYRDDLTLMYFPRVAPATGKLFEMEMVPQQIRRFRLNRVSNGDAQWLQATLDRECRKFGAGVEMTEAHTLALHW